MQVVKPWLAKSGQRPLPTPVRRRPRLSRPGAPRPLALALIGREPIGGTSQPEQAPSARGRGTRPPEARAAGREPPRGGGAARNPRTGRRGEAGRPRRSGHERPPRARDGPQEARGGPRAAEREPEAASEASSGAPQRAEAGGSRARAATARARPRRRADRRPQADPASRGEAQKRRPGEPGGGERNRFKPGGEPRSARGEAEGQPEGAATRTGRASRREASAPATRSRPYSSCHIIRQ